jgi:hypothetical protein
MIKVGCDPEFTLLNASGSRVTVDMFEEHKSIGTIKGDHGGAVGELNPVPDTKPTVVVENLRKLILKVKEYYPSHKLVAGGGLQHGLSTGGHIHLSGMSDELLNFSVTNYNYGSRSNRDRAHPSIVGDKLILVLDSFIATKMQKLRNGKRADKGYNLLSKIKRKTYPYNIQGFEYRSTPSFIVSPYVTEAVLATAQHIANMWAVKPQTFDEFLNKGISSSGRFRKHSAKFRDYDMLYPAGTDSTSRYYRQQIINFKTLVFNRSFDLGDLRAFDYWAAPTSALVVARTRDHSVTLNRTIQLQPCQLTISRTDDVTFSDESVIRVVRFAVPEVKINPIQSRNIPWTYRTIRDRELHPDVIYISKNLRPF